MEIHPRFPIVYFLPVFLFSISSASFALEIEGKIQTAPPFSPPEIVEVRKDQDFCGSEKVSQSLIVSKEGFVANVVVSLKGNIPKGIAYDGPAPVLDQKKCNFSPHILLIPPGLPFFIGNDDLVTHDVRAFEDSKMIFQFETGPKAKQVQKKFEKPGIYVVRCGVHRWMHAFAVQMEHPYYAVTDAEGKFAIRGIAPGSYQLQIWHETLGEATIPVEVSDSIRNFSYTFPAGKENA